MSVAAVNYGTETTSVARTPFVLGTGEEPGKRFGRPRILSDHEPSMGDVD